MVSEVNMVSTWGSGLLALRGGGCRFPRPCRGGAGREGTRRGLLPRGGAGAGHTRLLGGRGRPSPADGSGSRAGKRRIPGGERRLGAGSAGPLLRQLRGRARPQRLPASNGAPCRPPARTAALPRAAAAPGAQPRPGALLVCLAENKIISKNNNQFRLPGPLSRALPIKNKKIGFCFCACSQFTCFFPLACYFFGW